MQLTFAARAAALALARTVTHVSQVRVIIASSEQCVRRGDFGKAIGALNSVPRDSTSFAAAQAVKARILLTHRRDRKAYAQCYR
jgi:tetratricopeptide repeat protein 21B